MSGECDRCGNFECCCKEVREARAMERSDNLSKQRSDTEGDSGERELERQIEDVYLKLKDPERKIFNVGAITYWLRRGFSVPWLIDRLRRDYGLPGEH